MTKNLSNNQPVKSTDKKCITNLPLDDRLITPIFDMIPEFLGKEMQSLKSKYCNKGYGIIKGHETSNYTLCSNEDSTIFIDPNI